MARSLEGIPGLGTLVKVLQFNKGTATGGEVTDTAAHFKVDYKNNPSTMTFTINGARALSGEKDFKTIKKSSYVSDVYKNMILDDSAVKFTIVFNKPVKYEVMEYKNPAHIAVTLSEDKNEIAKTVYSVRTSSYGFGEILGQIEEQCYTTRFSFKSNIDQYILYTIKLSNIVNLCCLIY